MISPKIAVIDFGLCNLDSVVRAIEECGGVPEVMDRNRSPGGIGGVILPGVGAFADAMASLRQRGLDEFILEASGRGLPLLGICLGMQLLADRGLEGGECAGLGLIGGEVRPLPVEGTGLRLPHIGWNEVRPVTYSPLLEGVEEGTDFYFVHGYHFACARGEEVLARTPYGIDFSSVVGRGRVFGVQFHPEKSQRPGFRVLRNFRALVEKPC